MKHPRLYHSLPCALHVHTMPCFSKVGGSDTLDPLPPHFDHDLQVVKMKVGPIEARDHAAFSGVLSAVARLEGRTSEPDEATASLLSDMRAPLLTHVLVQGPFLLSLY